jgi:hypothetical protein
MYTARPAMYAMYIAKERMYTVKVTTVEGTAAEVADYMRLLDTGSAGDDGEVFDEEVSTTAEVSSLDAESAAWLKAFIWSRGGAEPGRTQLVEDYARRVLELEGVSIEHGTSQATKDGLSPYLMVRDDGPRKFGAVVYIGPRSARLNFRLMEDDVQDVADAVEIRKIVKGQHHYRVNLHLRTAADVDLALDLTARALEHVRA